MSFHVTRPNRRSLDQRKKYQDYREDLRADFNGCCGYCDDSDTYLDRISFHIDHFAPQDQFPDRATTYLNLVYACRYCNIRKSNTWIGSDPDVSYCEDKGFVDPCAIAYDDHLTRDSSGRIVAATKLGEYMIDNLNLHLIRHQLLWNARRARNLRDRISELRKRFGSQRIKDDPEGFDLLDRFMDLSERVDEYEALAANG